MNLADQTPRVDFAELLVETLGDEAIVFDPRTDRCVSLNSAAFLVFEGCDGSRTIVDLADSVEARFGAVLTTEVVWSTLGQLESEGLLASPLEFPASGSALVADATVGRPMSRRTMIGLAAAAAALPVVTGLVAPSAAAAQSSPGGGGPDPQPTRTCTYGQWVAVTPCSEPCGGGTLTEARSVVCNDCTSVAEVRQYCPDTMRQVPCNTDPCP